MQKMKIVLIRINLVISATSFLSSLLYQSVSHWQAQRQFQCFIYPFIFAVQASNDNTTCFPKLSLFLILSSSHSASTFHAALQDAEARHRSPGWQLGAPQVYGERKPSAQHRVAEGQPAAGGRAQQSWGRGREEQKVDPEPEELDAGAEREVHLPRVQQGGGDQRHLQSRSHTWVGVRRKHTDQLSQQI